MKHGKQLLVAVFLLLNCLVFGTIAHANADADMRPSLVHLSASGISQDTGVPVASQGTGFFVSEEGFILTSEHLLDQLRSHNAINVTITAKIADAMASDTYNVYYVTRSSDVDLMLLKATIPFGAPPVQPVKLGLTEKIDTDGDLTYRIAGFNDQNYVPRQGKLINTSDAEVPYTWRLDVRVLEGQSGGPVYLEDGEVIGVVKGQAENDDQQALIIPIELATPLISHIRMEELRAEIGSLKDELSQTSSSILLKIKAAEDQIKLIQSQQIDALEGSFSNQLETLSSMISAGFAQLRQGGPEEFAGPASYTGNGQSSLCPQGQYMVGARWQVDAGGPHGIMSWLGPVCRAFPVQ